MKKFEKVLVIAQKNFVNYIRKGFIRKMFKLIMCAAKFTII